MINKKYYCSICDKYILNKSSHNKTKVHTQLSLSIVNKYYISNVPVIEIENVINKHIYDYNKKFLEFVCWCKVQNEYFCEKNKVIWEIVPDTIKSQEKILKRYNCRQNDLVYIEIIIITDLESTTYNHYLQLPKPMIERKICQIIDHNPNLEKILDNMPKPYKKHIIVKHWDFQQKGPGEKIYDFVPVNWMDLEPTC